MNPSNVGQSAPRPGSFRHHGVPFRSIGEFIDIVAAPMAASVNRGEPVVAIFDQQTEHALRDRLGDIADAVQCAPPDVVFAGPVQSVARNLGRQCAELVTGGPATVVGCCYYQPWVDARVFALCESLFNLTLADAPLTMLCGCPQTDPDKIRVCYDTHPQLLDRDGIRANPDYRDPVAVLAEYPPLAPEPLGRSDDELQFGLTNLRMVRRFVSTHAADHGLTATAASRLTLAINEIAANTIEHGAGHGVLRIWHTSDELIWEIRDTGRLAPGQLLGLGPRPTRAANRGRGLWLAREFSDHLHVWHDDSGTGVRGTLHHRCDTSTPAGTASASVVIS